MIKVDINYKKKSWQVKETVDAGASSYEDFSSRLKSVQKQANVILTRLVEEECDNGKVTAEPESDCDDDDGDGNSDTEPEQKRKKT